jgi:hypothetical protein
MVSGQAATTLGNNVVDLHVGGHILNNAKKAEALSVLLAAGVAAELHLGVVLTAEFAEVTSQQDRLSQLEREGQVVRRHGRSPLLSLGALDAREQKLPISAPTRRRHSTGHIAFA